MAYKALYRKYRPETFEKVVGQKHIITTLSNAIKNDKVAHAYIFSGPRGTGKTTTAKILAKALNCTSSNEKPCNECANCKAINDGSFPDVIEIDAASNNGVDEVRDLIEGVKYAPIQGKYKVYIIDEVHMMTPGAFNALLKTLEEPPAHAIFILATTDVHKVLPTIESRCQRFDFSKISFEDIQNRVSEILNFENIKFDEKVPAFVAELADGGMRDALSILDQVVAYAGDNITLQHIYDIYGMTSSQDMVNYFKLLGNNKTREVLEMIEDFISKGVDIKRLTHDLMVCLKDTLVYKSTNNEDVLERLNSKQAKEISDIFATDKILAIIEILNKAMANYRQSTNYRMFFEIATLNILSLNKKVEEKIEPIKQTIETKEIEKTKVEEKIKEEKQEIPLETKSSSSYVEPQESESVSYTLEEYVNILNQGDRKFKEEIVSKWGLLRNYVMKKETAYVSQLLVDAYVGAASHDYILIVFKFSMLARKAKQINNIQLIHQFIKEVFGYDVEVYTIDSSTYQDATKLFRDLWQAHKLPPKTPLPHLKIENSNEETAIVEEEIKDATEEISKELFGNSLKIE